ncbi:MAG: fluoride efflux transporter CrcB [Rhodospirillaceae bacterium]
MTFSIPQLLAVMAGGAAGAAGRYLVMLGVGHWFGNGFPYGTMVVNIIGSFMLGAFVEASALAWSPSPEVRALIVIGVLGAFTTFSTLSLDVYVLWSRGDLAATVAYVAGLLVLGVGALVAGLWCVRMVVS